MKKIISLFLAVAMVFSMSTVAFATTPDDINDNQSRAIGTTAYYTSAPYGKASEYTKNFRSYAEDVQLPTTLDVILISSFKGALSAVVPFLAFADIAADVKANAERVKPSSKAMSFYVKVSEHPVISSTRYFKYETRYYADAGLKTYVGTEITYKSVSPF